MGLFATLSINDTGHSNIECSYAECHYAESHYSECRGAHIKTISLRPNVINFFYKIYANTDVTCDKILRTMSKTLLNFKKAKTF